MNLIRDVKVFGLYFGDFFFAIRILFKKKKGTTSNRLRCEFFVSLQ